MDYIDFFKNDRFAMEAGIKLTEVRPGYAKAELKVNEHHLNAGNVVQGGALFTLADLAIAAAATDWPADGRACRLKRRKQRFSRWGRTRTAARKQPHRR